MDITLDDTLNLVNHEDTTDQEHCPTSHDDHEHLEDESHRKKKVQPIMPLHYYHKKKNNFEWHT